MLVFKPVSDSENLFLLPNTLPLLSVANPFVEGVFFLDLFYSRVELTTTREIDLVPTYSRWPKSCFFLLFVTLSHISMMIVRTQVEVIVGLYVES